MTFLNMNRPAASSNCGSNLNNLRELIIQAVLQHSSNYIVLFSSGLLLDPPSLLNVCQDANSTRQISSITQGLSLCIY